MKLRMKGNEMKWNEKDGETRGDETETGRIEMRRKWMSSSDIKKTKQNHMREWDSERQKWQERGRKARERERKRARQVFFCVCQENTGKDRWTRRRRDSFIEHRVPHPSLSLTHALTLHTDCFILKKSEREEESPTLRHIAPQPNGALNGQRERKTKNPLSVSVSHRWARTFMFSVCARG